METNQKLTKDQFAKEVYKLLQRKLHRGDNHVSNIAFNKVTGLYITLGYKNPQHIIDNLEGIKPAKSVADLLDHITKQLKEGQRTDGVEKSFAGLEF